MIRYGSIPYVLAVTVAGALGASAALAQGNEGDDTLFGEDDTWSDAGGNDDLSGGAGNDILFGGAGDDTYRFGRGDGQDLIADTAGTHDVLIFGAGIGSADIAQQRNEDNLVLTIKGSSDQVTVAQFFGGNGIEEVHFADGTVWDAGMLADLANKVFGTAGADVLQGTPADDRLYGLVGNDQLSGLGGNDVLDGCPGPSGQSHSPANYLGRGPDRSGGASQRRVSPRDADFRGYRRRRRHRQSAGYLRV